MFSPTGRRSGRRTTGGGANVAAGTLTSLNLKVSEAPPKYPAVKFSLVLTGGADTGCKAENSLFERSHATCPEPKLRLWTTNAGSRVLGGLILWNFLRRRGNSSSRSDTVAGVLPRDERGARAGWGQGSRLPQLHFHRRRFTARVLVFSEHVKPQRSRHFRPTGSDRYAA